MNVEQLVRCKLVGGTEVPTPVPLCHPQIPRYPTWDRNPAVMVEIRRVTANGYGMALNIFDGSSKLLLALASIVNIGFGPLGTHDYVFVFC
jgi:hypothetical protein